VESEVRDEHPEFFLTMHDSLLCSFCVAVEILFEEKETATSLWSLIRKSDAQVASNLQKRIRAHKTSIKKVETIRHQVCAHRWQAKSPQGVFAEVRLRFNMMTEIADLARSIILELTEAVDTTRKAEIERQQLSDSTLCIVADDATQVLLAFRSGGNSAAPSGLG
jgi:hypothetical protein